LDVDAAKAIPESLGFGPSTSAVTAKEGSKQGQRPSQNVPHPKRHPEFEGAVAAEEADGVEGVHVLSGSGVAASGGGGSFVEDAGLGFVEDLPSGLPYSPAPLHVLHVGEVASLEQTHPLPHAGGSKQSTAWYVVHDFGAIVLSVVFLAKAAKAGEVGVEAEPGTCGPDAMGMEVIEDFRTDDADGGVLEEAVLEGLAKTRLDDDVVV